MWKLLGLRLAIGNAAFFKLRNLKWKGFLKKFLQFLFSQEKLYCSPKPKCNTSSEGMWDISVRGVMVEKAVYCLHFIESHHSNKEEQELLQN